MYRPSLSNKNEVDGLKTLCLGVVNNLALTMWQKRIQITQLVEDALDVEAEKAEAKRLAEAELLAPWGDLDDSGDDDFLGCAFAFNPAAVSSKKLGDVA